MKPGGELRRRRAPTAVTRRRRRRRPPAAASLRPGPTAPPGAPRPRCAPGSRRRWTQYFDAPPRDFLAVATPGRRQDDVRADGRRRAARPPASSTGSPSSRRPSTSRPSGPRPRPGPASRSTRRTPRARARPREDYVGVAVTYAGVAVNPLAMRIRTERFKTLVILDEVHHAGDALSWGEGVREAFEPAHPAAGADRHAVPLRHQPDPVRHLRARRRRRPALASADYTYGYAHALADHVVRPVLFMAYSGEMQWRTRAGDEIAARLGEPLTKDLHRPGAAHRARPARVVDAGGAGGRRPAALRGTPPRARRRRPGHRHRPGLGPRLRQAAAADHRRDADRRAVRREGRLEEDRRRSPTATSRWMVAVRMVSEGVDVPRLAVGVYATTTSTPLFFAQAVGRFVRARRRGETASVFLPSVPHLLGFASEMEVERDHVLGPHGSPTRTTSSPPRRTCSPQANAGEARVRRAGAAVRGARLDGALRPGALRRRASSATRARCTSARRRRWTSSASPGLLEPDQVRELLHSAAERARPQAEGRRRPSADTVAAGARTHEQLGVLRRELNGLVAAWHHRTGQAARHHPRRAAQGVRRTGRPRSPPPSSCRRGSTGSASGPSRKTS